MSRIHLLQILGNAIIGGMETYVLNLLEHLPAEEFQVTCLCPFESAVTGTLRHQGYEVYIVPMEDDPRWRSIQLAVELVRQTNVDLIHGHLPKGHALAGLVGNLTGRPAVATIHGMNVKTQELGIHRTTGTHLLVICRHAYLHGLSMGIPAWHLSYIANGVDLDRFNPTIDGSGFREEIGVPKKAPLVGFVGRLSFEKGPDQFMRTVQIVHRERPDVHFVMVGTGPLQRELELMVEEMKLQERMHFAGTWPAPWQVYPALDVLAQTSREEGMPLVLLEAMASGCPVVAIGVGGTVELVEAGVTGWTVGPGDWEGAAWQLLELLNEPARRAEMQKASRRRAEKCYDLNTSVQQTANLLRQLVNGKALRPAVEHALSDAAGSK